MSHNAAKIMDPDTFFVAIIIYEENESRNVYF